MPIEIRELVIRATVDPHSTGKGVGNCATGTSNPRGQGGGAASGAASAASGADEELLQACVREVLRILEQRRER